jgi:sulfatase maturation enzyme AslB (radical SAM superfamily)
MRQELEVEQLNVFDRRVADRENRPLHALDITTIQVNIGLTCNLKCVHCHVSSGPTRKEQMTWETMELTAGNLTGASAFVSPGCMP